jgi:excisionase family DNA binding protein
MPPESAVAFESLISSAQAARLLGNLHVKTLQRYARVGRLPGYQIGRHWYFRESELDAWTVAKANGIHTRIGWHIFRRTFGTLLKANGEDVKTVQELLRHANSRITLEVYTQAVTSHKRAAQTKVVRVMVPDLGERKDESHP